MIAIACSGCERSTPREPRAGAAATPRPNLIVIVIDTLRRDHLGLYGYARPTTPQLDDFARSAVVFERCMAASSWTEPSTASLLSGLYPTRHGAHEYAKVPAEVTMLAEVLHDAGYRTFAVSGNPNASPLFGFEQGFDAFHFPENEIAREYPDVIELVAQAERFLAERGEQPFFLYMHVMNVHGPYRAPPEYRERFLERPFLDFPFQNELWNEIRKGKIERRADVQPEHLRDLRARYDGAIAYTDHVVGDFLARRLAAGGAGGDLVVITGDHGEELFDHGSFGHGFTLYREVVDVPLLLRRPGGEGGGTRIDAPVSLVDLPATILDLLGLLAAGIDGRFGDGLSLVPLFEGGEVARDAPLVAQLQREKQGKAYLLEQWPLRVIETTHELAGRRDVQLFDLERDPIEARDLAATEPARAAAMRTALQQRRAALEKQALRAEAGALSDEDRRRLDALGYGDAEAGEDDR